MPLLGALAVMLLALRLGVRVTQLLKQRSAARAAAPAGDQASTVFSKAQLAAHDGTAAPTMYISILGDVYDVSAKPEFYKKGSTYHHFVGVDGTRAFVTGEWWWWGWCDCGALLFCGVFAVRERGWAVRLRFRSSDHCGRCCLQLIVCLSVTNLNAHAQHIASLNSRPGEFQGPPREDIEDLTDEEVHTIVGWRKFYLDVRILHCCNGVGFESGWWLGCQHSERACCRCCPPPPSPPPPHRATNHKHQQPPTINTLLTTQTQRTYNATPQTYPQKGKLEGAYYSASGQPTSLLLKLEARAVEGERLKEEKEREEKQYVACSVKYSEAEGGWAVGLLVDLCWDYYSSLKRALMLLGC